MAAAAQTALADAGTIVIAPSNPLVSIGPMRSMPGVDELLASRRDDTVAVSPIVGGAALKGPADAHAGRTRPRGERRRRRAACTRDIAAVLVIDPVDGHLADDIEQLGMRCVVTPSIMSTPQVAAELARTTISSVAPS